MFDFSGLNPEQALAAAHPKGAALVLAGPGSGKTLLIVNRIRYLIEYCQAAPENILVITFTRAAAKSMQQRFTEAVCGRAFPVTFGTFHAIFFQILKMYDSYDHHSLLTNKDKMWYLGDILDREYHGASKNLLCQRLLSLFGFYQNHPHVSLEPLLPEEMTEQEFQRIFTAYQNRIRDEGKLDFDDMAERCLELFHKKPEVLRCLQQQYRYVLIDEYQDTNAVQDAVIRKLVGSAQELFAVGDEDQAIYGFRGSAPDIMSSFERRYPGARRYTLEQNYRSTGKIVEAAGKVIAENKQRYPKKMTAVGECGEPVRCQSFEKQEEQYACIVARMKELSVQMPYEEMAVITRTNRELELIAELLRREKIPCDVKERKKAVIGILLYGTCLPVWNMRQVTVAKRLSFGVNWAVMKEKDRF